MNIFRSINIGRFLGVETTLHWSIWPALLYILLVSLISGGFTGLIWTAVILLLLFAAVYLHELAHTQAARLVGVKTLGIVILPVGGMARLDSSNLTARRDMAIAAAGPLANLGLFAIAWLALALTGRGGAVFGPWFQDTWLVGWAQINLLLGLSNLLPAFPLDGGRLLRAALAIKQGRVTATMFVVKLTRYIAMGLILWGFFSSYLLILLGIFLLIVSIQEAVMARFAAVMNQMQHPQGGEHQTSADEGEVVDAISVRRMS